MSFWSKTAWFATGVAVGAGAYYGIQKLSREGYFANLDDPLLSEEALEALGMREDDDLLGDEFDLDDEDPDSGSGTSWSSGSNTSSSAGSNTGSSAVSTAASASGEVAAVANMSAETTAAAAAPTAQAAAATNTEAQRRDPFVETVAEAIGVETNAPAAEPANDSPTVKVLSQLTDELVKKVIDTQFSTHLETRTGPNSAQKLIDALTPLIQSSIKKAIS